MNEPDVPDDSAAARISALLDGEVPRESVAEACRAWRGDAQSRAQWHAYSLIGDVLRSGDLANPVGRDRAFLQAVHERLVQEPVVLAPIETVIAADRPVSAKSLATAGAADTVRPLRHGRNHWVTPVGIAAGVALVSVLAWTGMPRRDAAQPMLAVAGSSAPEPVAAISADTHALAATLPPLDEPLDAYLNAHRLVPGKAAFGPTAGFMRSVAHDTVAR